MAIALGLVAVGSTERFPISQQRTREIGVRIAIAR